MKLTCQSKPCGWGVLYDHLRIHANRNWQSATLSIVDDDLGSPQNVALSGIGS